MTNQWYLGKRYDLGKGRLLDEPVFYDPDDLTTHAFVVGMTGSGKTGLAITLLEEAALSGIPALLIDPKGDLTNIALHFPHLRPEDFAPWISAEEARREGKTMEQKARESGRHHHLHPRVRRGRARVHSGLPGRAQDSLGRKSGSSAGTH